MQLLLMLIINRKMMMLPNVGLSDFHFVGTQLLLCTVVSPRNISRTTAAVKSVELIGFGSSTAEHGSTLRDVRLSSASFAVTV